MSLQILAPLNKEQRIINMGVYPTTFIAPWTSGTIVDYSKFGKSYNFNNTGRPGYVSEDLDIKDKLIKNDWSEFTMSAWIKLDNNFSNNTINNILSLGDTLFYINNQGYPIVDLILYEDDNTYGLGYTYQCEQSLSSDVWYNVTITCNLAKTDYFIGDTPIHNGERVVKFYINGEYINFNNIDYEGYDLIYSPSIINRNSICIGNRFSNADGNIYQQGFAGCLSDVRIYDNVLSEAEIKEISKGLCTHYKLDNPYIETTYNLLGEIEYKSNNTSTTWDTVKQPNAINVKGWTSGENDGINPSDPKAIYHAMWNMIDGEPTMVFQDTQTDGTHKWLGINTDYLNISINSGEKYTISFYAKGKVGMTIKVGLYYTASGSRDFYDSLEAIPINSDWNRYEATFTASNSITQDSYPVLYVYGNENTVQGVSFVKYVQLEKSDHATPYAKAYSRVRDAKDLDMSFMKNGELSVTNVSLSSDSEVYEHSYNFTSSSTVTTNNEILRFENMTVNIWCKLGATPSNSNLFSYAHNNGLRVRFPNATSLWCYMTGKSFTATLPSSAYDNKWHMVTFTYDKGSCKLYYDGELLKTYSAGTTTLNIANRSFHIGSTQNSEKFTGKLSDYRVYATTLSPDDIMNLYQVRHRIDNIGDVHTLEINSNVSNLLSPIDSYIKSLENYTITAQQPTNNKVLLSATVQSHCHATADHGVIHVTRDANLTETTNTYVEVGLRVSNIDHFRFIKGHSYVFVCDYKGSNELGSAYPTITSHLGYNGIVGLAASPTYSYHPSIPNSTKSEYTTISFVMTINDDVYKVANASSSVYVQGQTYPSYNYISIMFGYSKTNSKGTDMYFKNFRLYDITDSKTIKFNKNGVIENCDILEGYDTASMYKYNELRLNKIIEH